MAVTGTGSLAAQVQPLYPKPKRGKPKNGQTPVTGVNAKKPKGGGGGKQ